MNRNNKLDQLDDRTLLLNLWLTQGIVLLIALLGSWFLYTKTEFWQLLLTMHPSYLGYAVLLIVLVVASNIIIEKTVPPSWVDDGGMNERIFRSLSIPTTFLLCVAVGISEEWLFRGVIHELIGNVWTSILFTAIHFRYLQKPILIGMVFLTSYLLGILFTWTNSLITVMFVHATINFVLALFLKYKASSIHSQEDM
ncbi:CPBP family intramembrane glutamic endopeptidase [Brevibacillus laterosporus]|uniref:CPBP family intramembrane glutamic endopeptidase n=1 Tax=Brevibacillus laterosporus TaxID=1465 RepID=UPI0003B18F9B|nr:CPBP family intramembrane glutamic endopeptidase [Brevibacillus laterosporus]WPS89649.1 CPBP family intramembrane glutamic endopeptidase [Brevibacillus halotolerans]AUM64764.1 CPBP family intramembrane metalloprotease [Brevibacillus laterosporus]AYK07682.1 CPBP family intramembrane metalloprotease [Brevibacillus laterosporus]ERM20211.1 metallopeptidase [Brevibacillus laterosporus PE36]MDF9411660.1 CPBP family intramembrane metalloprotease [Brevibacillus laterosporus]